MTNKHFVFSSFLLAFFSFKAIAQIGIGTTHPHPSAILDIESSNKGFLLPRLTENQRNNINSPISGLMIFNTDDSCINFYSVDQWVNPCASGNSNGGASGGSSNLPANFILQANNTIYISSVYDENYFPYTPPVSVATTNQLAPDGNPEAKIIDYQGVLTTTGLTIKFPYLVFGSSDISMDTIQQTKTIDVAYIEGGGSSVNVELEIPGGTFSPGSGFINGTLKAIGSNLNAKKLDINAGMGTDLGVLISEFIIPSSSTGDTDTIQLKIVPSIPDRNFGNGTHDFVYMPVQAEDGNLWLTNNLGAEYADINSTGFAIGNKATSSNDEKSYGSKFQWGRPADGHELMSYTSSTSGSRANSGTTNTLSTTSTPVHNQFITNRSFPYDWLTPQDNTLWDGKDAPNNPCPDGFRLPTNTEWSNYNNVSGVNTSAQALSSKLAISSAGYTNENGDANSSVGSIGFYWAGNSSVIDGAPPYNKALSTFYDVGFSNGSANNNVFGYSVRCIQNETNISSTSEGTAVISSINDCNVASTGTLTVGQQAPAGVTQTINVTTSKAGTYFIYAFNNGIQFFANGILNLGSQDVVLTAVSNAFMIPQTSGTTTFSLNVPSSCSFDRIVN